LIRPAGNNDSSDVDPAEIVTEQKNRPPAIKEQQAQVRLREVCASCHKPRVVSQDTSLANWFFGTPDYNAMRDRWGCTCESSTPEMVSQLEIVEEGRDPLLDSVVGRWRIVSLKGKGYLGNVYEAVDTTSGAKVAIRVFNNVLSQNPRIAKRFLQEAEKAKGLTHTNIGMVSETGRLPDGNVFVVSEWIDGATLATKLKSEGFFTYEEAVALFLQICDALSESHEHGVVHRGIRPSNIFVRSGEKVKVVDFGLEKAIPPAGKTTQFLSKVMGDLGDPHYMSPEQCLGKSVDKRSDIYSLGSVMYEVLTGKKIHGKLSGIGAAMAQLNLDPERFEDVMYNSDIPLELEKIVFQCLEKNPENRYQNIASLHADLESVLDRKAPTNIITASEKSVERTVKPPADHTMQFLIGGIFMVILLSASILMSIANWAPLDTGVAQVDGLDYDHEGRAPLSEPKQVSVDADGERPLTNDAGNTRYNEHQIAEAMLGNWHYNWENYSGDMIITTTWGRRFAGFMTKGESIVALNGRISVNDDKVFFMDSEGATVFHTSTLVGEFGGKWKIVSPEKSETWKGFDAVKREKVTSRLMYYDPFRYLPSDLAGEWVAVDPDNASIKKPFQLVEASSKGVFKIIRANGKPGLVAIDDQRRVIFEENFAYESMALQNNDGLPSFGRVYAKTEPAEKFRAFKDNVLESEPDHPEEAEGSIESGPIIP